MWCRGEREDKGKAQKTQLPGFMAVPLTWLSAPFPSLLSCQTLKREVVVASGFQDSPPLYFNQFPSDAALLAATIIK